MPRNPKYKLITYGCQMNKSDSERIEAVLENIGFSPASKKEDADLILLNTCSVRQTAEHRVYGQLNNLKKLKKRKPHLLLGVTGCMAGRDKDSAIRKKLPMVDLFFGISDLPRVPEMISKLLEKETKGTFAKSGKGALCRYLDIVPKPKEWWRGCVVIQTGCSKYCAYCVVPHARGHEQNRSVKAILAEARKMVRGGAKEIILLGQAVNSYIAPDLQSFSKNNPLIVKELKSKQNITVAAATVMLKRKKEAENNFAALLWEINQIDGINRISFASAHPMHMNSENIKALGLSKMINHLHLPVQSGDNEILKKMNRNYTRPVRSRLTEGVATTASGQYASNGAREQYLKIIEKIRKVRPNIALATDIIVGFPGETKKQFANTVSLYKKCDFDMSYNAMYSPRTGTSAYKVFKDDIPHKEKRRRWLILQDLMKKNVLRKNKKYLGKTVEVLIDGCAKGKCYGLSREYKKVVFKCDKKLVGEIINVKIDKIKEWELYGEIIND